MGGGIELEIRRCGEILRVGIQKHEGLDLEFPQGTDKSVFLENAYFMALINANKVQTDGIGGCWHLFCLSGLKRVKCKFKQKC